MTFAQRQSRLKTHFSESIPVVKRRISVPVRRTYVISTDAVTSVQPVPKQRDLQFWHSRSSLCWAFLLLSFMADVRLHDISWRKNADVRHSWLLFWGRTEESKTQRNIFPPFYSLL